MDSSWLPQSVRFCELTPLRILSKCIVLAGYHIEQDYFVLCISHSKFVLSDDERRLGCILIDMGGGTSDIAVFNRGILEKILVVPRAGAVITEDIAIGLKTPISFAESIKQEYGSANAANVDPSIEIEIEGISGRAPSRKTASLVSHVIQHRVEDILNLCYNKTKDFYTPELVTAGIVLTGGTANLRDIAALWKILQSSRQVEPNLDQSFG
jgi:cell division protein FtsA